MRVATRIEHAQTVFKIVSALVAEPLAKNEIIRSAGFACNHLDRMLLGFLGETTDALSSRLILERAAFSLRQSRGSVASISLEAGYAEPEAFTKAFRNRFGLPPTSFRQRDDLSTNLMSPANVHWCEQPDFGIRLPNGCVLRQRPSKTIAALPFVGDYRRIPSRWRQLAAQLPQRLVDNSNFKAVTVFHSDGMLTSHREEMRAHLGFLIDDQTIPTGFEVVEVSGGIFVEPPAAKDSNDHAVSWAEANRDWVPKNQPRRLERPGFDEYQQIPADWASLKAQISLAVVG